MSRQYFLCHLIVELDITAHLTLIIRVQVLDNLRAGLKIEDICNLITIVYYLVEFLTIELSITLFIAHNSDCWVYIPLDSTLRENWCNHNRACNPFVDIDLLRCIRRAIPSLSWRVGVSLSHANIYVYTCRPICKGSWNTFFVLLPNASELSVCMRSAPYVCTLLLVTIITGFEMFIGRCN